MCTASILECEEPLSQSELGIDYVMADNEDVIALPALKPNETVADIQTSTNLESEQERQVKRILGNYRDVMTDLPGETNSNHVRTNQIKTVSVTIRT